MKKITEIALFTNNVKGLVKFYERFLGAPPASQRPGSATFQVGDLTLLIHQEQTTVPGQPPCEDHVALTVPSVDEAAKDLASKGLAIEVKPGTFDWGRSAYLRDPDGRLLEITETPAAE